MPEQEEAEDEERQDEVEEEGEERGRPKQRLEEEGTDSIPSMSSLPSLEEAQLRPDGDRRESLGTVEEPEDEAPVEEMAQSVASNQRLDGIPVDEGSGYEAQSVWRRSHTNPYFAEFEVFFQGDDAAKTEEAEGGESEEGCPTKDYWVFDPCRNVLQRHHVHWRRSLFNPMQVQGCPVPLRAIKSQRQTTYKTNTGEVEEVKDEWSLFTKRRKRG